MNAYRNILKGVAATVVITLAACSTSEPVVFPCQVKEANTSNPYSNDVEIDKAVQDEMCAQGLYGLAVGIVKDGQVIYLKGYGYEDFEEKTPVASHETMFRWASMSKMVTGVAAVQSQALDGMNLDVDVRAYVEEYPWLSTYAEPDGWDSNGNPNSWNIQPLPTSYFGWISTRMLLQHTSGIKHYTNGPSKAGTPPASLRNDPNVHTDLFWAGAYFWDDPDHLLYQPGTTYSYSTFGFNLAGMAIERASAGTYWEKVRDRLAVPLGMTPPTAPDYPAAGHISGTFFQPDYEWVNIPRRAVGYRFNGTTYVPSGSSDVSWKLPGGGFISPVRDLAAFCAGLMTREDVISSAMKDELWQTSSLSNYGLGFAVGSRHGRTLVSHNGGQQKARTRLALYPEDGLCFVVMTNSEWANSHKLTEVLEDAYRGKKTPLNQVVSVGQ